MNHVVLIGRLTGDPELRYTPNGVAVTNFRIAVDRTFSNSKGEREVDFIPIVVWQKQAENCANYLKKGQMVAVEGRLQVRSYEAKDGQKRWVTEVYANNVQFLSRPKEEGEGPAGPSPAKTGGETDDFGEINLDDLPF